MEQVAVRPGDLASLVDRTAKMRVQEALMQHRQFPALSVVGCDAGASEADIEFKGMRIDEDPRMVKLVRFVLDETKACSYMLWDHGRMQDLDDGFTTEMVICFAASRHGDPLRLKTAYLVRRRAGQAYLEDISDPEVLARLVPMFATLEGYEDLFAGPALDDDDRVEAMHLIRTLRADVRVAPERADRVLS